ncbi:MAG: ATP-binding protein [Emergencia timonensis]|uniref:ATP-binding protein n=2 Tax=Emergencia timonensis TaxID=1776384 RepID=UPI000834B6DD|nr:ATP-binding protein [Emergencia timonensis]WNX88749.1 ATP-binding protein [Emergencia timonensis]
MKKVKFRKSLATNIIVIFMVFNILSIVLFTYYVTIKEESKSTEYAKKSMQEIVDEKSELIAITFDRIKTQVGLLGIWTEKLLQDETISQDLSAEYVLRKDGTIVRKRDESVSITAQSNIMVPKTTVKTAELMKEINLTEELDEAFAQILEKEDVTWAYIATKDNLLRCSPYRKLQDDFTSDHSQIKDIFYTMANEENNPQRKPVWTPPYTDYLGTGWTMTCSQPVYDANDQLYGVICLDLAIDNIKEKYFEGFSLGESGKVYWLDHEGNILYHTDFSHVKADQGQVYEKNIFTEGRMSSERVNALKAALDEDSGIEVFGEDHSQKMMVHSQVPGTDSALIIEIDMKEYKTTNEFDLKKAGILIIIDLFLAAVFGLLLYDKFSRPMKDLVNSANRISKGDYSSIQAEQEDCEDTYYEISQLNQAFMAMNDSIESYTETLLDKNRQINTILDTIEGTLMIVDIDGMIKIQSKVSSGITQENITRAIAQVNEQKQYFTEQLIVDGEVYKNVYYPIMKETGLVDQVVISSECITKSILLEKEMQQLEKMAGVGQLSAAIVHELKNVLALIKGAAYILDLLDEKKTGAKEIATIMKAVEEAENVITTLLDFSRRDSSGSEMIHIGTLVNQILLLSKKETIGKNIDVRLDVDVSCYIYSSGREALKVILQNIIINAIQAVSCDGWIEISCHEIDSRVLIRIRDNGGGIRIEPKERVFEPFMTTKERGTGIGLWITKRLVDSLEGEIAVTEPTNGETEFVISIPKNRSE